MDQIHDTIPGQNLNEINPSLRHFISAILVAKFTRAPQITTVILLCKEGYYQNESKKI